MASQKNFNRGYRVSPRFPHVQPKSEMSSLPDKSIPQPKEIHHDRKPIRIGLALCRAARRFDRQPARPNHRPH
jgi:hypothetical protein